ncbi:retrovirus-related pol polyprotein from transposon TNT 1-94, partial [Tanacetum coccineum]
GQARVVKCYNCQSEGHMARQRTQPKMPRNDAWFKDKAMLTEAHESGQILDEEQLAFLADLSILDVLMANLSNYGSDVISDVPHPEPYNNDMDNQSLHAMQDFEQTSVVDFPDNEITKLSAEQAFWLQTSNPNIEQSDISPVRIEAPSELPKTLKDIFDVFDKDLLNEVTEVQTVFNQIEAAIQQCSVDKQCFEFHKKELFLNNDRLLHQIMSQDLLLTVMNSTTVFSNSVNLKMQSSESYAKCFDLDAKLLKNQHAYNALLKKNDKDEKVKHDMDEIETINIELEHSVAKLLFENELLHKEIEHLKKIYKDQLVIAQLNSKSMENADFKGQVQEKFFVTTALQNELRRLKGYPDCSLVSGLRMLKTYDTEPLSAHELPGEYLEVAFWKNTCFIRNLDGVDLPLGSRDSNLNTISLDGMLNTSPICLLSKASKTKSWLWHRRLSHLNFGTLNKLAKDGLARGIPKLKFKKDHLCSASALGKSKKSSHQPKAEDTNQEKLYFLHMELYGRAWRSIN